MKVINLWVILYGYLLKLGQFKVKTLAERSRSGQLASTPLSERSLLMTAKPFACPI